MASNSYRAAEYFAPIEDPRHTELGLRSRDAFRAAMQLSDWLFEPLEIRRRRSAVVWLLVGVANRVIAECCLP